jgi:hypothetical protein
MLLAALSVGAAPLRVILLGPARDHPPWVAFQIGLRAALAEMGGADRVRLEDRSPRRLVPGARSATLETLASEAPDAWVVWPENPADAVWAGLFPHPEAKRAAPVFWIGANPASRPVAGHWEVDWDAWAAALQIVAASRLDRAGGAHLAAPHLDELFPAEAGEALRRVDAWPATGDWSLRGEGGEETGAELVLMIRRDAIAALRPEDRGLRLYLSLDALTLHQLRRRPLDAIVTPHFVEAGGEVAEALLAAAAVPAKSAPPRPIRPLVVTAENLASWNEYWGRWQY